MHRLLFTLCLIVLATPRALAQDKPLNFVVILMDDLGWRDTTPYGHPWHETPHIDRLAQQGLRFTQAYAACPVCSPTRASLLTGKYPARIRLTNFLVGKKWPPTSPLQPVDWTTHLPHEELTLPELLKQKGYATAHIGKWHLGPIPDHLPTRHGFDHNIAGGHWGTPPAWFSPYKNNQLPDGPKGEYLVERLAAESEKFLDDHKDKPFYLQLWDYNVHIPLRSKEELIEKYRNKPVPPDAPQPNTPVYAAMCEAMDQSVGRIMKKLDDLGIADHTVVIFTSDNGGLGVREGGTQPTTNHPLRNGKGFLHEGGIRVPFIIRCPKLIQPNTTNHTPITSPDLLPTIWQLAGGDPIQLPKNLDGQSLLPLLKGGSEGTLNRDTLYWHYPHYANQGGPPGSALRHKNHKLIKNYEDNSTELYDLATDPSESTNLAQQQPQLAADLSKRLDTWLARVNAQIPQRK